MIPVKAVYQHKVDTQIRESERRARIRTPIAKIIWLVLRLEDVVHMSHLSFLEPGRHRGIPLLVVLHTSQVVYAFGEPDRAAPRPEFSTPVGPAKHRRQKPNCIMGEPWSIWMRMFIECQPGPVADVARRPMTYLTHRLPR